MHRRRRRRDRRVEQPHRSDESQYQPVLLTQTSREDVMPCGCPSHSRYATRGTLGRGAGNRQGTPPPNMFSDPLDCASVSDDVEAMVETIALRRNMRDLKAQVSHSAIFLNGDCQVGFVAIDAQRRTARASRPRDAGGDGSAAPTHIEKVHSGAKDARQVRLIPLQSASLKDTRIGAVRLLAHFRLLMMP